MTRGFFMSFRIIAIKSTPTVRFPMILKSLNASGLGVLNGKMTVDFAR